MNYTGTGNGEKYLPAARDYVALFHLCSGINEHWHRARWSTHFEAFSSASTATIKAFTSPPSPALHPCVRRTNLSYLCVRECFFLRFSVRPYARFARVTRETASPFLKAASIMRVKGEKRNVSSYPWKLCGRYTFHAFLSTPFQPPLRPHTLAHS